MYIFIYRCIYDRFVSRTSGLFVLQFLGKRDPSVTDHFCISPCCFPLDWLTNISNLWLHDDISWDRCWCGHRQVRCAQVVDDRYDCINYSEIWHRLDYIESLDSKQQNYTLSWNCVYLTFFWGFTASLQIHCRIHRTCVRRVYQHGS